MFSGGYVVSSQLATGIREESYWENPNNTVEIPNGVIEIRFISENKIRVSMPYILSSPVSWRVYEGVFER